MPLLCTIGRSGKSHSLATDVLFFILTIMELVNIVRIIWMISCVGLMVLVLLHSPKGDGLGGLGGQAQLFTSTKSAEKTLNRITWTLTVIFMGLTVILSAKWLEPIAQLPTQ